MMNIKPVTHRSFWKVNWAQEFLVLGNVWNNLTLVPYMIARCDDISANAVKLLTNIPRNPNAMCGIFTIHNGDIRFQLFLQSGQMFDNGFATGTSNNIA